MTEKNDTLRTFRLSKDLKQSQVAEILGISQQIYSRAEIGISTLTGRQVEKLCTHFGCSPENLGYQLILVPEAKTIQEGDRT